MIAIEPLGIVPDHRRHGLAGAMCLMVADIGRNLSSREIVIDPRGDDAYPAPRGAYQRVGFKTIGRTRLYRTSASLPAFEAPHELPNL